MFTLDYLPQKFKEKLTILYGEQADYIYKDLLELLNSFLSKKTAFHSDTKIHKYTYEDIALITYANSIVGKDNRPFKSLLRFSQNYLKGILSIAHILPFYPWDIDRGFSIKNFYEVDPRNGNWEEFSNLRKSFDHLMVDLVLNHASIDNPLVQGSLIRDPKYKDFVISYNIENQPSTDDLSKIIRPRDTPMLTKYYISNKDGILKAVFDKSSVEEYLVEEGLVWTTFSRPNNIDGSVAVKQVDLNFKNYRVFFEMIKILMFYYSHGADWIRLDAIPYIWKNLGTKCIHLKEVHLIVELLNDIIELVAPEIVTIAEVNEPQRKVIPYLGTKENKEADMIYQFTHYPMAIHAVLTENSTYYANWIKTLESINGKQFITVLGSHDGMGRKPIMGILPEEEIDKMIEILIEKHGALPNYARLSGGKKIVYELCSTPWNLINRKDSTEKLETQIDRFMIVIGLGLIIRGVPALYINGLLGIPNRIPLNELDENRTINRERLEENSLFAQLNNEDSEINTIFHTILRLIKIRKNERAFSPQGPPLRVVTENKSVLVVILETDDNIKDDEKVLAIFNVTNKKQEIKLNLEQLNLDGYSAIKELITDTTLEIDHQKVINRINLGEYQIAWYKFSYSR